MTQHQAFFDPWRTCCGPLADIAADIAQALPAEENRKRKRRAAAEVNFRLCVDVVFANLAHGLAHVPPVAVAVSLANRRKALTRYDRRGLKRLTAVLEALHQGGLIILTKSKRRGQVSSIIVSSRLKAKLKSADITQAHIGRAEGEELVVVNRTVRGFTSRMEEGEEVVRYGKATQRVDYVREVTWLHRTREDLKSLNRSLHEADLQFLADDPAIDLAQRTLKRVFSLPEGQPIDSFKFNSGGRLFGGWWQRVHRSQRHLIRINSEPAAEVDFEQLFPRLACLKAGVTLPPGDVYAVPGFEQHRAGIKKVVNALIFATKPLVRLPKDISRDELPAGLKLPDIRSAILAHQPLLAAGFEKGLGLGLMYDESRILLAVLKKLMAQGVVALPLHDAVIVSASEIAVTMSAMRESALEVVGSELPLKVKELMMDSSSPHPPRPQGAPRETQLHLEAST
ncbi:MAG: hypothetical protein AB7F74_11015 [Parvibaculaceae bacterium]